MGCGKTPKIHREGDELELQGVQQQRRRGARPLYAEPRRGLCQRIGHSCGQTEERLVAQLVWKNVSITHCPINSRCDGRGALRDRYPVPAGRGAPLPPRRALHASPTDSPIRIRAVQVGAAGVAIAWGAYQLREKIKKLREDAEETGAKLTSTVVLKEIAITLAGSTISFLTGGVAEAIPDLFGFAVGASELVKEGTEFGTAEAASMLAGEAQDLNIGTVVDAASVLRDLVECCKKGGPGRWVSGKCTCTDSKGNEATMTMKDVNNIPDDKPDGNDEFHVVSYTTDELIRARTDAI